MQVQGVVGQVRFHNDENGWTVLVLSTEDGDITCTGTFLSVAEGESWRLDGELIYHDRYGEQLRADRAEKVMPKTADQIERYLASGVVPYVGKATAKAIVARFGERAIEAVIEDADALKGIRGIGRKKSAAIRAALIEQYASREVQIFLQGLGLGPKTTAMIYRTYKDGMVEAVSGNPYRLIDEVEGIGFITADQIALKLGVEPTSAFRIKAAILYILSQEAQNAGGCYLEMPILAQRLAKLIGTQTDASNALYELALEQRVLFDEANGRYYLTSFSRMERDIASKLILMRRSQAETPDLEMALTEIESAIGLKLAPMQRRALEMAASHSILVITGGPGTGKTTILRAVLEMLDANGLATQLAAPTGRAAKRMEESTGRQAQTLHRLLGYKGGDGYIQIRRDIDEADQLTGDALVIDEASMVDIYLMSNLMRAVPEHMRIILVGDVDQLPSVGPGNVLSDLIASGMLATIKLDTVYRQGAESLIITNAHRINHGMAPILNEPSRDFFFLPARSAIQALELVEDLVMRRLPEHYGFNPSEDIQILTAMKKGACGVENLNAVLQKELNPVSERLPAISCEGRSFRPGDKVMQIKNDYKLAWRTAEGAEGEGVYNGDFGRITAVEEEGEALSIDFDGRIARYELAQLNEIDHAYAITIHKSQGSEFPCVIIPVVPGPPMLLSRNILYTAITRAKQLVVLVGDRRVVDRMIANTDTQKRRSSLNEQLIHFDRVFNGLFSEEADR